jgi:small basic protein (TIGR04137 family)
LAAASCRAIGDRSDWDVSFRTLIHRDSWKRWGDFGCFCGDLIQILRPMSQHPSLKGKGAIKAKRSVLKRFERVELMKKRGQFKEGQRVIGLPKTKPED